MPSVLARSQSVTAEYAALINDHAERQRKLETLWRAAYRWRHTFSTGDGALLDAIDVLGLPPGDAT